MNTKFCTLSRITLKYPSKLSHLAHQCNEDMVYPDLPQFALVQIFSQQPGVYFSLHFFENSIKYRVFLKLIRPFTYLLMAIKGSVIALLFKQFNMCPLLNNLTILHDNDLIERNGLDDTMGDKNGSLAC